MAVVTVKSGVITNRDASPPVSNASNVSGGVVKMIKGTVEVTNGDSIGSKYIFGQVPSNAVINSIRIFCDAITSAAGDIGLYQTTANGSAVLLATAYASAQSIASAIVVGTEVAHEARDIANIAKRVFEDGGLTTDPQRFYDIVLTLTAAATASGTVSLAIEYVDF